MAGDCTKGEKLAQWFFAFNIETYLFDTRSSQSIAGMIKTLVDLRRYICAYTATVM